MTPLEAQALLAGITLDTRNFALHTGVRTFEAAAYLRRMGAQTQEVKKLFCDTLESYTYKGEAGGGCPSVRRVRHFCFRRCAC